MSETSKPNSRTATITIAGDYISAQGTVLREWDVEKDGTIKRWAEIDCGNKIVSGPLTTQPKQ